MPPDLFGVWFYLTTFVVRPGFASRANAATLNLSPTSKSALESFAR